jgi:NitT/TauT family transport system substrate-binding protein
MAIRLQETQRALFYAPFYATLALDVFRDEGVDVSFHSAARPENAASDLFTGAVDVSWGGPMRIMLTRDRDASDLVGFCEVVTRDPFFLIGRGPRENFTLKDLPGLKIGIVSEVPTPWCCLQEDIRRAGIDPESLDLSQAGKMPENVAALRKGALDVVQLFEPFVEELLSDGSGHIWYAAADRGPTSYTCLYARESTLTSRHAELAAMTRAIYRVQKWIAGANPRDVAGVIQQFLPGVDRTRIANAVRRYQTFGVWGKNPHLPREGFERLRAGLLSSGLIKTPIPFERAIDNRFAAEAIAANPPPAVLKAGKG